MQDLINGVRVSEARSDRIQDSVLGLHQVVERQAMETHHYVAQVEATNNLKWEEARLER